MKPSEINLLGLLQRNNVTFFIPPYQRNYEWEKEQCQIFIEDVTKTAEKNYNGTYAEHFFGTITYFVSPNNIFGQPSTLILIDGQQRITTTMLFLAALRDSTSNNNIKNTINTQYLKNNNTADNTQFKIKLKQVAADWTAYKGIILNLDLAENEKNSAIYQNYIFFKEYLRLRDINDEEISLLLEKGLDKLKIIALELEPIRNPWEDPQEIFESMNSLGKPLSLADLVRNYLLMGQSAKEQTNLYNNYWLHIENTIRGHISSFIRDYMQLVAGESFLKATENNYKELYRNFKKIFDEQPSPETLAKLHRYASIYSIILNCNSRLEELNYYLKDLVALGTTTAYSMYMGLLDNWQKDYFTDKEIIDILFISIR